GGLLGTAGVRDDRVPDLRRRGAVRYSPLSRKGRGEEEEDTPLGRTPAARVYFLFASAARSFRDRHERRTSSAAPTALPHLGRRPHPGLRQLRARRDRD